MLCLCYVSVSVPKHSFFLVEEVCQRRCNLNIIMINESRLIVSDKIIVLWNQCGFGQC
jgi:hypothetical protein